jgi:hypothetical protein
MLFQILLSPRDSILAAGLADGVKYGYQPQRRSIMKSRLVTLAGLLAALGLSLGAADVMAHERGHVNWSVSIGTPVYEPPATIHVRPRNVYGAPPPVMQYRPGYFAPPPYYVEERPYYRSHHHKHRHHHRHHHRRHHYYERY